MAGLTKNKLRHISTWNIWYSLITESMQCFMAREISNSNAHQHHIAIAHRSLHIPMMLNPVEAVLCINGVCNVTYLKTFCENEHATSHASKTLWKCRSSTAKQREFTLSWYWYKRVIFDVKSINNFCVFLGKNSSDTQLSPRVPLFVLTAFWHHLWSIARLMPVTW